MSAPGSTMAALATRPADPAQIGELDGRLRKLSLSGVVLRGAAPLWLGLRTRPEIAQAVKNALELKKLEELEIKREAIAGELASPRQAALPIAAAIGGMIVPASIYFLANGGGFEARGWAIPMATA